MFKKLATLAIALLKVATAETDADRSFAELCEINGFQFEEHTVITDDKYILTLYRIPGEHGDETQGKPAVLMQHGVMDSAYGWVMNHPEVAPGFVAAKAGYDVWFGNSRGNTYSRSNLDIDPDKDPENFFKFSWQEMGDYDLPAVFRYVTEHTQ